MKFINHLCFRPRRINAGSAVRPLRPGPRINLAARGRGTSTTTTTTEGPVEDHITGDEEPQPSEPETSEKVQLLYIPSIALKNTLHHLILKLLQEETPAPVDNSPLARLRNKNRVNIASRPKAAASATVQVRRVNPLIARRRPGQTTAAPSTEAPQEPAATEAAEEEETEPVASSTTSTTTEEPRGLNKLLAGRRKLGARTPGTLASRQ